MSVDYRFTIKRKADDKKLGTFYYNRIKSLYDIYATDLKFDPENISSNEESPTKFTSNDITNDINLLKMKIASDYSKIFEKKLLIPQAANKDIKDDIEADIYTIEEEIKDLMYALEALSGLYGAITAIVEDLVRDSSNDPENESSMAYIYNAEGLPNTAEGYSPSIWVDDVYIEVLACY